MVARQTTPVTTVDLLRFYTTPAATSALGRRAVLATELTRDPEALGAIVRGLLVHNYQATVRGLELPPERWSHMQTVGAERILDNVVGLDPRPLTVERPIERRMVGFCYHFALLHCALLRSAGIPSRARCGFASYFKERRWIDHWVVEWWDGGGWRLTDSQIGRTDLGQDDFQSGVMAWAACRADPSRVWSYGNGELWGWDELRGSLINDVAALSKVEVSGWYWCDRIHVEPLADMHEELDASLDILAEMAATAMSVDDIVDSYSRHPEFHAPPGVEAR